MVNVGFGVAEVLIYSFNFNIIPFEEFNCFFAILLQAEYLIYFMFLVNDVYYVLPVGLK